MKRSKSADSGPPSSTAAQKSSRLRRLCGAISCVIAIIVTPVVVGILVPATPILGAVATLIESALSAHLVLLGFVGLALAQWGLRGRRTRIAITALLVATSIGALFPLVSIYRRAVQAQIELSWLDHLRVAARQPALPDETVQFAAFGDIRLSMDIYRAQRMRESGPSPAIFMMHPGSYVAGARSDGRNWDRWLADRGYVVFDVDYRLAPPATWNIAPNDVACAIAWVYERANKYGVDVNRIIVAGQSAGGGLALQVAYALGDGTVESSCGGHVAQPVAVIALYPAGDLHAAWLEMTGLGPLTGRQLATDYTGGSPAQYPDRYRDASPITHVRRGLPPTLLAFGEHDHLLPSSAQLELAEQLSQVGVPAHVVSIPYAEHAYDLGWEGLGTQITRAEIATFLQQYVPRQNTAH